ncbi:hypothetical protein BIW11_08623, partial [Tropilaelaps mercedesae]
NRSLTCSEMLSEICLSTGVILFCHNSSFFALGTPCNPGVLRYDQTTAATVIDCNGLCNQWEGNGCFCQLPVDHSRVAMNRPTMEFVEGRTISNHCTPKHIPRYCSARPEFLRHIEKAWFDIENEIVAKYFFSNVEEFEDFRERVRRLEPYYEAEYERIYMLAREAMYFYNMTPCVPVLLTMAGLYMTSTEFGQRFLKAIFQAFSWNQPHMTIGFTLPGPVEYWMFTNHRMVFELNDPCTPELGTQDDLHLVYGFYVTAQLLHFLTSANATTGDSTQTLSADGVSWGSLKHAESGWFRSVLCMQERTLPMECERILFWKLRSTFSLNQKEEDFLIRIYGGRKLIPHKLLTAADEFYWITRLLRLYAENKFPANLHENIYPPVVIDKAGLTLDVDEFPRVDVDEESTKKADNGEIHSFVDAEDTFKLKRLTLHSRRPHILRSPRANSATEQTRGRHRSNSKTHKTTVAPDNATILLHYQSSNGMSSTTMKIHPQSKPTTPSIQEQVHIYICNCVFGGIC